MLFKVKSHTSSSVRLNVLAIIEYSSDKVMENTPLSSVCKVMCKKNVNALYIECQIISVMFNTVALLRANDGLYGLYKLSALLTVCILSTYESKHLIITSGLSFLWFVRSVKCIGQPSSI